MRLLTFPLPSWTLWLYKAALSSWMVFHEVVCVSSIKFCLLCALLWPVYHNFLPVAYAMLFFGGSSLSLTLLWAGVESIWRLTGLLQFGEKEQIWQSENSARKILSCIFHASAARDENSRRSHLHVSPAVESAGDVLLVWKRVADLPLWGTRPSLSFISTRIPPPPPSSLTLSLSVSRSLGSWVHSPALSKLSLI